MVPESSQVGEVSLYKCVNSPLKWRMKEVLLKNVSAVDKMIIKIDDILVVTYKYVIPNIECCLHRGAIWEITIQTQKDK